MISKWIPLVMRHSGYAEPVLSVRNSNPPDVAVVDYSLLGSGVGKSYFWAVQR